MQCKGIEPHLTVRGKLHGFSQVVVRTWDIGRDTSGLSLRLARATGMLAKVRQETQGPFPVATVILGFLPTFKRSQASPPFEALIMCVS